MTNSIFIKLKEEVTPKIKEEFSLKNDLSLPKIEKIVLAIGASEALTNKESIEKIKDQLTQIAGQRARVTRAKQSISNFKLKKGDPIGVAVTLRGKRAHFFLEKLIAVVIPKMRDFRGVPPTKFDANGNYSLGITEQILFPEIDYAQIDRIRGLVVTVVFKNSSVEKSKKALELLGLPFRDEGN